MLLSYFSQNHPLAHTLLVLCAIAAIGLALSRLNIRGVGLGIAGVLFSGLFFGHLGVEIDHTTLEFLKEFGLILFVFTIGLQLGPGFFASMRRQGLRLNILAACIVLLGFALTVGLWRFFSLEATAAAGLFSGATTNTPSLGAAQQILKFIPQGSADMAALLPLAYAVAYPFAVAVLIFVFIAFRFLFRINIEREAALFYEDQRKGSDPLTRMNIVVENMNLDGLSMSQIPGRRETQVSISRIQRRGSDHIDIASEKTVLHQGDIILAVGTAAHLEQFRRIVGRKAAIDLMAMPSAIQYRKLVVTHKDILGKTVGELGLDLMYGVMVTRVMRAEIEIAADRGFRLQFGDILHAVGEEQGLDQAASAVGNSVKALNETNFLPVFVGIALGVLAGLIPISIPGLPVPVRLGLAGGPLIVAILLSRMGRIGPLLWYMPANANAALREMGIVLFLACIGLKAGGSFSQAVFSASGVTWVFCGLLISAVPIIAVGIFARIALKVNYVTLCGLLSGAMTDPPALAFANAMTKTDAPAVAYATVYPLTMLLRILAAQMLILLLF